MTARFKVVAGTDPRAPRRPVERKHLFGGGLVLAAVALGGWALVDPTLHGTAVWLVPLILLAVVMSLPGIRQEIAKPVEPEHWDQRILHVHTRRGWWR